jgi:MHS family proline/betaine transporter-like MFS transporter
MDSMLSAAASPAHPAPVPAASQVRRAVIASVIGNGLEWFDFLIYGYFAKTISHVFFPVSNAFLSTVLTLATFAIGFVVRPLGGIVLGAYADRVGRRRTLSLLILLMAASTLLMSLTPGYSSIGIAAPLLVLLSRVLQGVSVGGEFATAAAMLSEYAPRGKKMFYGSFQMTSQAFALLLSSACGYLLTIWTALRWKPGAGACRSCSAR